VGILRHRRPARGRADHHSRTVELGIAGFGAYNYGEEPVAKADEHGLYRLRFAVPEAWKGRRIRLVFEA